MANSTAHSWQVGDVDVHGQTKQNEKQKGQWSLPLSA